MTERFEETVDGFTVIGLRTAAAELTVCPELGMRVLGFNDRKQNRQWLWSPPRTDPTKPRLFRNRPGDAFDDSPLAGIDECIPGVGPCPICPDHGEVWPRRTAVLDDAPNTIRTRVSLPGCGLDLERAATLDGRTARFDYRLTNPGKESRVYLWAAHPLLSTIPGDRIELPPGVDQIHVTDSVGVTGLARNAAAPWPRITPLADAAGLRLASANTPAYVKAFASGFDQAVTHIRNDNTQDRLTLRFDATQLPALGVWISRGGWNGYHQVALEPTNAPADTRTQAADLGSPDTQIAPGETRRWWWSMQTG